MLGASAYHTLRTHTIFVKTSAINFQEWGSSFSNGFPSELNVYLQHLRLGKIDPTDVPALGNKADLGLAILPNHWLES